MGAAGEGGPQRTACPTSAPPPQASLCLCGPHPPLRSSPSQSKEPAGAEPLHGEISGQVCVAGPLWANLLAEWRAPVWERPRGEQELPAKGRETWGGGWAGTHPEGQALRSEWGCVGCVQDTFLWGSCAALTTPGRAATPSGQDCIQSPCTLAGMLI